MVEFDGYISDETVSQVSELLSNPQQVNEMTQHNYNLARKYYSYEVLDRQLEAILSQAFGEEAAMWWEDNLGKSTW